MAKEKKKCWWIFAIVAFIIYIFVAARPIPQETILKPRWITSLESNFPVTLGDFSSSDSSGQKLLPFHIGERYGYVGDDGKFTINQIGKAYISLSEKNWAEYDALPSSIQVMNPLGETVLEIKDPKGYPMFLDGRIFIVSAEQNSISAIGSNGEVLWVHDFPAPITCVDASGGYVLAGTLDGTIELLNSQGKPVITPFEPGGSRLSVILGCAISSDASRLALISGVDNQRFLLLEYSGNASREWSENPIGVPGDTYKVIHHEFISSGFRRPVHINFVDNDGKVAYEREGGLGIYDIGSRSSIMLPVEGKIEVLDNSDGNKFLFLISSKDSIQKSFIAIRYPGTIVIEAPFNSEKIFFGRRDKKLYLGGDLTMASFELGSK